MTYIPIIIAKKFNYCIYSLAFIIIVSIFEMSLNEWPNFQTARYIPAALNISECKKYEHDHLWLMRYGDTARKFYLFTIYFYQLLSRLRGQTFYHQAYFKIVSGTDHFVCPRFKRVLLSGRAVLQAYGCVVLSTR